MNKYALFFAAMFFLHQWAHSQPLPSTAVPDSITLVEPGARLLQVQKQFAFTEGPAVDKKGDIYFTDQPNDKIWKFSFDAAHPGGMAAVFMDKTGRANGLYVDSKGNLVACADEKDQLWSISPDKKVTVLLKDFQGLLLNGPNDLWIDHRDNIYFTDPYYQRDYWERKRPDLQKQAVYYMAKAKPPIVVDSTLVKPNGIVGTPDGKYLYVADLGDGKTYKYEINKDGTLSNRRLFASMGSDGMTIDEKGNLYLTGKGVTIFDTSGKRLGVIPVPAGWVGNICFGGPDRKTLFITASDAIYTIRMQVRGVE
jgi:gluconolactonase